MIEDYFTAENATVLMAGMVLGGAVVTWGLIDTSNLPPKSEVEKYALEKYKTEIVEKRPYVKNVSQESLSGSRYPSFYKATYHVSVVSRDGRQSVEKQVYISKDGLMMFTPERIVFDRNAELEFAGKTAGEYVEN